MSSIFADGNIAEQLYGQIHPVRPEQLGLTQIECENSAAPFQAWLEKHDLPPDWNINQIN